MKRLFLHDDILKDIISGGRRFFTQRVNGDVIGELSHENLHYFGSRLTIFQHDSKGKLSFADVSRYEIGEEIALMMSYRFIVNVVGMDSYRSYSNDPGYLNKAVAKTSLMPYRVKISNIGLCRLQFADERKYHKKRDWDRNPYVYYYVIKLLAEDGTEL